MIDLYLIRHGKTQGNMERRYVGSTDEPLCEAGIQEIQERRTAWKQAFLSQNMRRNLPETIFVSPMLRCRQTAELLFPHIMQTAILDFREMDFGQFEYRNYKELANDARYQAFIDSGGSLDFPDAESQQQFRQRVRKAFAQCMEQGGVSVAEESQKPLVFVLHGGTIMAIMEAYALPYRPYYDWQVEPVSGYHCELVFIDGGFALKNAVCLS